MCAHGWLCPACMRTLHACRVWCQSMHAQAYATWSVVWPISLLSKVAGPQLTHGPVVGPAGSHHSPRLPSGHGTLTHPRLRWVHAGRDSSTRMHASSTAHAHKLWLFLPVTSDTCAARETSMYLLPATAAVSPSTPCGYFMPLVHDVSGVAGRLRLPLPNLELGKTADSCMHAPHVDALPAGRQVHFGRADPTRSQSGVTAILSHLRLRSLCGPTDIILASATTCSSCHLNIFAVGNICSGLVVVTWAT